MRPFLSISFILLSLTLFSGCAPVATTAAGVGGSAALNHSLSGTSYRTFTAPAPKVRAATVTALGRMKIKLISEEVQGKNSIIMLTAKTSGRNIAIELEPISSNVTRMTVSAKRSFFLFDNATAEEIIMQTRKSLG